MKLFNIKKIFNLVAFISVFGLSVFAQNPINGFTNQRWIPTTIEGIQIKDTQAFIAFDESGNRLSGNAGCNRLFGSFEVKGKRLKFSEIGTTKMFCSEEKTMKT